MKHFRNAVLRLITFVMLASPAVAQSLSFGVKAGAPVTDPFILSNPPGSLNNYAFSAQRYTVGPTFELGLPYNLAFEADALYKPLHYISNPFGFNTFQASTSANSWEFPLLIKGHLLSGIIRPFGNGGVSFRHVGGSTSFTNSAFQVTQDPPLELVHSWSTGYVAGGGVDFGYGPIHVSPEIRYTRWASQNFNSSNGILSSNLNAVDILIGLTFIKE
jgi:opacity protein-like surface antigen